MAFTVSNLIDKYYSVVSAGAALVGSAQRGDVDNTPCGKPAEAGAVNLYNFVHLPLRLIARTLAATAA